MDDRPSPSPARPLSTGRGILLITVAIPLLLACTAGGSGSPPGPLPGGPVATGPDDPVVGAPPAGPPADPSPTLVEPEDGLVDLRPVTWERVEVAADGVTLTVHWAGGVEACYGLAAVEVERREDGSLAIGLWEGTRPEAVGQACIELAAYKATTIRLEEPLIVPFLGGPEG